MNRQGEQSARGFAAGVFIGLAIVMPVFAATTPELERWALPMMFAATMLFIAGLALMVAGLRDVIQEAAPLAVRAQPATASALPRGRPVDRRVHHVAARQPG